MATKFAISQTIGYCVGPDVGMAVSEIHAKLGKTDKYC